MGVDILGPFPRAVGGYRFLFVAIDKFTKWPEATPMVSITQGVVVAFLKSIVCRFGVPSRIITNNGTQFRSRLFQEYCEGIGTHLCFASVAHPKINGQVERARALAPSSALRLWLISRATARWRGRTQRSSGDSRHTPITA
jgi:hypothetical protein